MIGRKQRVTMTALVPRRDLPQQVSLRFDQVSLCYLGRSNTVLNNMSFHVPAGQILVLTGPSGCGKTSLLLTAAGLLHPTRGQCLCHGDVVDEMNPYCACLFQEDTLLPWKTVDEQGQLAMMLSPHPPTSLDPLLSLTGLESVRHHYPHQLSGGQRKRVMLLQCLIRRPPLLLLDEPFSSLDICTRQQMGSLLLQVWESYRPTILFVTHDMQEAFRIGQRIILLSSAPASEIVRDELIPPSIECGVSVCQPNDVDSMLLNALQSGLQHHGR
jgi:NitT/TauT family transport system ATP-binding protein